MVLISISIFQSIFLSQSVNFSLSFHNSAPNRLSTPIKLLADGLHSAKYSPVTCSTSSAVAKYKVVCAPSFEVLRNGPKSQMAKTNGLLHVPLRAISVRTPPGCKTINGHAFSIQTPSQFFGEYNVHQFRPTISFESVPRIRWSVEIKIADVENFLTDETMRHRRHVDDSTRSAFLNSIQE